jgi:hypothetical protein
MRTPPGGEEILVLEGVFRDENGEYPAGSWLCNPRWSRHTPYTGAEHAANGGRYLCRPELHSAQRPARCRPPNLRLRPS